MLGCPVQSLFWSRGGPWPWSPSMVLQSSCLVSPWLVAVVASRAMVSNLTISPHHLTSGHALAPFSSSPCFTVTQVGDRVALALSSSPGTGGYCCSARCKSSLVYQICVLGRENNPLHTASVRALPTRAKRKPDVDIQSIGNLPESVSRNSQGSPSQFALPARQPSRPNASQSNGGAGLQVPG